ncbi:hypothetical protein AgCh_031678 [Apium graveolens]
MKGGLSPDSKVCDFFLTGRKEYDEVKIRSTFNNSDAEAILSTHIPQSSTRDRIAWVHSKDGQYSVKSGYYQWQLNHMEDVEVQQSNVKWSQVINSYPTDDQQSYPTDDQQSYPTDDQPSHPTDDKHVHDR